jgi:dTDP-4-dehydrorhamnose reductase
MKEEIANSSSVTRVMVLGGTGMLGSMMVEILSESPQIELYSTSRKHLDSKKNVNWIRFNFDEANILQIKDLLSGMDYVINCVGLIKHKASKASLQTMSYLNTFLPLLINKFANELNFKYIQIGTDCIFSGKNENYLEDTFPDATDLYGISKTLSEGNLDNALVLRCSIIGPEYRSNVSLLEWFIDNGINAKINGFCNHFWNGISTLNFARIIRGIILTNSFFTGIQHLVPVGVISKYELLSLFKEEFQLNSHQLSKTQDKLSINRKLSTLDNTRNLLAWNLGGYQSVPTIEDIVKELAIFYPVYKSRWG